MPEITVPYPDRNTQRPPRDLAASVVRYLISQWPVYGQRLALSSQPTARAGCGV
jgi:hypothetical protein